MISLVFPTYNEEKVIQDSLKYLRKYKKKYGLELIVSDGQSTDNTVKLARKYADKVVVEKKRGTIAKNRNYGAAHAKGDILIEMDADSRIEDPDKFFTAVIEAFKDKNVVAATPIFGIYKEEETFKDRFFHSIINFTVVVVNRIFIISARGDCQIFRMNTFKRAGGYNESLVAGEDCDMLHRVSKFGKVKIFSKLKVVYSPRRFRRVGYVNLLFVTYMRDLFYMLFTKKAYTKEWVPIR
jgi:glycosyltransferase involved in cell wall biosynthesis